jgi:hypothetical protein
VDYHQLDKNVSADNDLNHHDVLKQQVFLENIAVLNNRSVRRDRMKSITDLFPGNPAD